MPVALSLALHGLAIVPLFLAGTSGSSASDDQPAALMVELSLAAPTPGPAAEADLPDATPEPQQQQPEPPAPPVEQAEETPPPEPEPPTPPVERTEVTPSLQPEPPPPQEVAAVEPEIKVELPPPDEPPPPTAAELKPVAPPKPKPPAPKPPIPKPASAPHPTAQAAVTRAPSPDVGNASITQQQAAASSLVVFEGKPRFRIPPTPAVYPPRSIELGQQGEVMVRVRLEPDGSAAEIMVWRSSSFPLLDRAALTAVRGWHFLPALRDGRPVAAWVEIPVRFHLR